MDSELSLSLGQAHKLELAMRRVGGWTPELVEQLSTGNKLAEVRDILLGKREIREAEYVVDCDAQPFVPEGWEMEEYKKGGQVKWAPGIIELYLSKKQTGGKCVVGNELRKELADKPVLNANVLDFILAHLELIPEEWKGKYIYFWGTVYRSPDGSLYVRFLYWSGGRWNWDCYWLGNDWRGSSPAALSASKSA
jgi:hypothetical protein